eukprot:119612_1
MAVFVMIMIAQLFNVAAFVPSHPAQIKPHLHGPKFGEGDIIKDGLTKGTTTVLYLQPKEHDDDLILSNLRKRSTPTSNKINLMSTKGNERVAKGSALNVHTTSDVGGQKRLVTKKASGSKPTDGINTPLAFSLLLNQVIIFNVATFLTALYIFASPENIGSQFISNGLISWGGHHLDSLSSSLHIDLSLTPLIFAQGVLGTILPLFISTCIEKSDDRHFATTNFSTIFMVMTLFGRRKGKTQAKKGYLATDAIITNDDKNVDTKKGRVKTDVMEQQKTTVLDVALVAAMLSLVTGFVEEITFRGLLPHVIESSAPFLPTLSAYLGQAGLFALGHTSPLVSSEENVAVGGVQFVYALWAGALYIMTGSIVPCMIVHALYDFQVLFFTWIMANDQLDYAEKMSAEPIPAESVGEVKAMQRSFGNKVSEKDLELCKQVFYMFDLDKNGVISRSEAQRGISYLEAQGVIAAPAQSTVDSILNSCIKMRRSDSSSKRKKGVKVTSIEEHTRSTAEDDELYYADFLRLFLTIEEISTSLAPLHPKFKVAT